MHHNNLAGALRRAVAYIIGAAIVLWLAGGLVWLVANEPFAFLLVAILAIGFCSSIFVAVVGQAIFGYLAAAKKKLVGKRNA